MVTIELLGLHMSAFHGIYDGERKIGSPYEIDVSVSFKEHDRAEFEDIKDTINYADIYSIIQQRMHHPTPLLEKVAEGIIRRIKHQYPQVCDITLSIYKLDPPIENFSGKLGVTIQKNFETN